MAVRWGVVGAGGIASRRTIPEGILPATNSQLIAVMDSDEERGKEAAEKFGGVRCYPRSEELYEDVEVDVVYVATPTYSHCREVVRAAEAGKHVLCEKPLGLDVDDAKKMIAACERSNVKLGVGFMMRFHPHHVKLKQMIEAGQLGHLVMGRAQLTCWYPPIEDAWRQNPKLGGGGSLIDMGSHCIDLLEQFLGKVTEVHCHAESLVQDYLVEDTAVLTAKCETGAIAVVDAHFNIPDAASRNILELYGTRGAVWARGTVGQDSTGQMTACLAPEETEYDAAQVRAGGAGEQEIVPDQPGNIYQAEIEAFANAIETGADPPVDGAAGLWNMKIMAAAYRSARSGRSERVR